MPFVLDASVTLAWCFTDEVTPYSVSVLDLLRTTEAIVPTIWPLEIGNVLITSERRRRLSEADSARFLRTLQRLPVRLDPSPPGLNLQPILAMGRQHALSAYDASYLELAERESLPLATQDARLRSAALSAGISLVE